MAERCGAWSAAVAGGVRILVPPAPPGAATIGVRPHDVTIDGTADGNALPGRVLSARFGGNMWHVRVQVGDADWLVEAGYRTASWSQTLAMR